MNTSSQFQQQFRRGFTLVETMVAVAMIGIVVISFYVSISSTFALIDVARQNLRATQLLVERTETLRLLNWSQVTEGFLTQNELEELYDPKKPSSLKFKVKCTLEEFPGTENYKDTLRLITVTATWTSGGVPRSRTMQTLVAQTGVQQYVY